MQQHYTLTERAILFMTRAMNKDSERDASCNYCDGHVEGEGDENGDYSFVHEPDCVVLLISDLLRIWEFKK